MRDTVCEENKILTVGTPLCHLYVIRIYCNSVCVVILLYYISCVSVRVKYG